MKDNLFGIVIEVENLVAARAFYRDILELGPPVMDSNFWVEFKLPGDFTLFLKKVYVGKKQKKTKNNVAWIYRVKNIGDVISRLEMYGYGEIYEKSEEMGESVYTFKDPEGNLFHLIPSPDE